MYTTARSNPLRFIYTSKAMYNPPPPPRMRLDGIQDDNSNHDHVIANDLSMVATDAVKHVQSASAERRAKLAALEGRALHNATLLWLKTQCCRGSPKQLI